MAYCDDKAPANNNGEYNDEDEDIGVDCLRKPLECRQEGECRRRWL